MTIEVLNKILDIQQENIKLSNKVDSLRLEVDSLLLKLYNSVSFEELLKCFFRINDNDKSLVFNSTKEDSIELFNILKQYQESKDVQSKN